MSSEILAQMRAERDERKTMESERRQDIINAYGNDPCDDGDVLLWSKTFTEDGPEYNYSATKARGRWYITGQDNKYDWVSFIEEIERDNMSPINVYKVSVVEELFVEEDEEGAE